MIDTGITLLRLLLGLGAIFFLGYAMLTLLVPRPRDFSCFEQAAFSFGVGALALTLWMLALTWWGALFSLRWILGPLLALAAALLLAVAPSGASAAVGAVLIGAGFAAIYPTTLAIVGANFAAFSGTAFSVVIALGLVGGMLAPWLVGQIAQASSLRQGFFIPVVNCAMIAVLAVILGRLNAAAAGKEGRAS
jgi:fucose permease